MLPHMAVGRRPQFPDVCASPQGRSKSEQLASPTVSDLTESESQEALASEVTCCRFCYNLIRYGRTLHKNVHIRKWGSLGRPLA